MKEQRKAKRRTPEKEKEIVEKYRAGIKLESIKAEFGLSTGALYSMLKRHGVPLREPPEKREMPPDPPPTSGYIVFPAFSDNWAPEVQAKWLEVYRDLHNGAGLGRGAA